MSRYDQTSIEYIMKYVKSRKWDKALRLLVPYCEKYPHDYSVRLMLLHTLLNLGCLTEARIVLETTNVNRNFTERTINSLYYATIKLLILEKKYKECLEFLTTNDNNFRNADEMYYIRAFCKKRLNEHTYSAEFSNYTYQQILDYSEESLFENVAKNHTDYETMQSSFQEGFPINEVYEIIKEKISDAPKTYRGLYFYETYFKCDNCGIVNNQRANYIYVSTFNDSEDIAFISPTLNEENADYIDINEYFIPESSKVKILSQTEKFNLRYKNTSA